MSGDDARRRWRTWRMSDETPDSQTPTPQHAPKQRRHTPRTDLIVFIDLSGFWPLTPGHQASSQAITERKRWPEWQGKDRENPGGLRGRYIDRQPWFLASVAAPNK